MSLILILIARCSYTGTMKMKPKRHSIVYVKRLMCRKNRVRVVKVQVHNNGSVCRDEMWKVATPGADILPLDI